MLRKAAGTSTFMLEREREREREWAYMSIIGKALKIRQ